MPSRGDTDKFHAAVPVIEKTDKNKTVGMKTLPTVFKIYIGLESINSPARQKRRL